MPNDPMELGEARRALEAAYGVLESEKRILGLIAAEAPLPAILEAIAREVESRSRHGMLCSVLLLDEAGRTLVHGAAPSLPEAYNQALVGQPVGPRAGSCGTAAFRRERVCVRDIAHDPLWDDYRDLAARHKLSACTSLPLVAATGQVLGTIAMYYRVPHEPEPDDERLIVLARDMALIAIERDRARHDMQALLASERAARSEAERASRMKDEFLAMLSHELRTPLASILGWTHILRSRPPAADELAKGLEVVERNARLQTQLIEDLLDMSRITAGKLRLDLQEVRLAEVVAAALETVRLAAQAKGVALAASIEPVGALEGDAARLQQVVWNLVSNSIKFTPGGGRVEVSLREHDGHACITVADDGRGMDPAFLPYVFEPFRQEDGSITRRSGGLGLGLALVKHIVEQHRGEVEARSDGIGRGATFVVRLPAR